MTISIQADKNKDNQSKLGDHQNFSKVFDSLNWDEISLLAKSRTKKDVIFALENKKRTIEDFISLISPAGIDYIEEMAQISYQLTRCRFGNNIQLYIPLYLSNKCHNVCTYCGFSLNNHIRRKTLNIQEIEEELNAIKNMGFEHVVLLTGEASSAVGMKYFREVLPIVKKKISHVGMEVQPLDEENYKELSSLGLDAVYVYQETYNKSDYASYHLRGNKQDFYWRLNTADRLGRANIRKIGIAPLVGLTQDWRTDVIMCAKHLAYLQKRYWRSSFSVSIPRLNSCEGGIKPKAVVSDKSMVQLICAWRLVFPDVEITLSTRESSGLRDHLLKLGITSVSAASSTQPGGYAKKQSKKELSQFEISDKRSVQDVVSVIKQNHLEVVWKNADPFYQ